MWMSAVLDSWTMRPLGLLPITDSLGFLSLRVTCVFLTVAAIRVN